MNKKPAQHSLKQIFFIGRLSFSILAWVLVLQLVLLNTVSGQDRAGYDPQKEIVKQASSVYFNSLGEQSGIYRGVEYTGYPYRIKSGHPFFESSSPNYGSIFYDGNLYESVPMWLDLVKNQLVVLYIDNYSKINLHAEKVAYFSVLNHHFIHINEDKSERSSISSGYYDLVYDGGLQLLVSRSKSTLKEVSVEGTFITVLKQKNNFFLKKGVDYYPVQSLGSVLKVIGSFQKEIVSDLKKNKIKFNKSPENTMVHMLKYYDQLKSLK